MNLETSVAAALTYKYTIKLLQSRHYYNIMSYHGKPDECQYIYMIKETNELALNVSLVVSFTIYHN